MSAKVIATVDLGYGDAGKGSIVDFLTRRYKAKLVFRYNGGSQAAHNVVTPDGRHHTFAQFGSGTFAGAHTWLSRFMLVAPDSMVSEAKHLREIGVENPLHLIHIDARAPITTPFHRAANRIKEIIRSEGRHGSCGMGIQETVIDVLSHKERMLYAGDLHNINLVKEKLRFLRAAKMVQLEEQLRISELNIPALEEHVAVLKSYTLVQEIAAIYAEFARSVNICDDGFFANSLEDGVIIAEGAQGVLLDEEHAFFPYATRSKTTLANVHTLLAEAKYVEKPYRLGIVRAYGVRHGPGPFVTEDKELTKRLPDPHNAMNQWQREFRVGWFDAVATGYAIEATEGVDGLALTCLDRLDDESKIKVCYNYGNVENMDNWQKYFSLNDSKYSIRFEKQASLERQEALTQRISKCLPIYDTVDTQGELKNYISTQLKPIAITSYGMSASDKKLIRDVL